MPDLAFPVKAAGHQRPLVRVIAHRPDIFFMGLEVVHRLQTEKLMCPGTCALSSRYTVAAAVLLHEL